ncbi:MAG TPA: ABC transporter permease [Candidatus Binatia bacterium]|jgi:NitT/TauT family transport system permease protein
MRKDVTRGIVSIVVVLVAWEILARLFLENDLLMPAPSGVARSFWKLAASGELARHFAATLMEFAYGFSAACLIGIPLGYFMGMHKWLEEWMEPWIATLYSIPIITIVPLIIIWFGIGMMSKVIVVFKITIVELILNTAAGVKTIDPLWLEISRSFRLSRWQTTYKVRLPAALPFIVTGMRLGVGRALLGVIAAELLASNAGLGYMLRDASETWDSPKLFVTVVLLAAMGIASFTLIKKGEQKLAPWRQTAEW